MARPIVLEPAWILDTGGLGGPNLGRIGDERLRLAGGTRRVR